MLAFNCIKVCVVMLFTQYLHDRAGTSASESIKHKNEPLHVNT